MFFIRFIVRLLIRLRLAFPLVVLENRINFSHPVDRCLLKFLGYVCKLCTAPNKYQCGNHDNHNCGYFCCHRSAPDFVCFVFLTCKQPIYIKYTTQSGGVQINSENNN